ncbi:MAG: sensor histidine kinase [Thermomicrobiales bacterium]
MFTSVGRKLAILNAAVVLGILALVSLAMFLFLQRSLQDEVDHALEDRAEAAQISWAPLFREAVGSVTVAALLSDDSPQADEEREDEQRSDNDDQREEAEEAAEDFVQSGDTIGFALAEDGHILANSRGVELAGLPYLDVLPSALAGESVYSDITIDGESVRVLTEPAYVDGRVAGAVQIAQGQGAFEAALRVVRIATLGGLLLGAAVAIPAGLFLANRSMRPIRRAFEQQRAFVADASHELRTPLTVMRAQAEYLQRSPDLDSDELAHGHEVIISEVDAMSRLVNDLLLLARGEQAGLILETRSQNLVDAVRQAVQSFEMRAESAGITLELEAPDRAVDATFDRDRIQQIIRILLDNALEHTPSGGAVTVHVDRERTEARVSVSDTGSGISPEDLPHVFDRFYRSRKSHQSSGLGLGLAIAKALVEAHGGEIQASSTHGAGTSIVFTLPF